MLLPFAWIEADGEWHTVVSGWDCLRLGTTGVGIYQQDVPFWTALFLVLFGLATIGFFVYLSFSKGKKTRLYAVATSAFSGLELILVVWLLVDPLMNRHLLSDAGGPRTANAVWPLYLVAVILLLSLGTSILLFFSSRESIG